MKNNSVCSKCGNKFSMGVNGIVVGDDNEVETCDKCAGVKRDKNGYAWQEDEQKLIFQRFGAGEDDFIEITREQAFSHKY